MKPIIFSTPMVQATLQGRKTQTRRITRLNWQNENPDNWSVEKISDGKFLFRSSEGKEQIRQSPYGLPGEQIYVRETWSPALGDFCYKADYTADVLAEPRNKGLWKPSIHMPKAAARLFLHLEDIRIERLQDITEEDAIKEGVEKWDDGLHYKAYTADAGRFRYAKDSFRTLWDSINYFRRPWDSNPWVWVVTYYSSIVEEEDLEEE